MSQCSPDIEDLCFGLRQRAAALGTAYQVDIDFFRACADALASRSSAGSATLADEIDRALTEYLETVNDHAYSTRRIHAVRALKAALWDNKAGIIAYLRAAAQTEQEPRLAGRLTDVIFMLDAPDAYNREYIAAVCRSILSSITSPDRSGT